MNLSKAPASYDALDQNQLRRAINEADRQNVKIDGNIELINGKLLVHSPNGDRWQIVVANGGALSTVAA